MASVLVSVADGIVSELEAGSFVVSISPERSYGEWEEDLTDLDTLHVDVVPVSTETVLSARRRLAYTCTVDIAVRQRFGVEDQQQSTGRVKRADVDQLVELVEQINEYMIDPDNSGRRLASYTAAAWKESEIRAAYVRDHLRGWRQFTGIVRAVYEVDKSL